MANRLAREQPTPRRWVDPLVRRGRRLARRLLTGLGADDPRSPLAAAYQLYLGRDSTQRCAVEARLLAAQTPEQVAARTGLPPLAVTLFEALFFQVSGRLHATAWVACAAIGRGRGVGAAPEPQAVLKAFAYCGGPLILELVWPYLVGPCPLAAAAEQQPPDALLDLRIRRAVATALLPESPAERLKLLRLHLGLIKGERAGAGRLYPAPSLAARMAAAAGLSGDGLCPPAATGPDPPVERAVA
jgi:hypothetical protein